MKIPKSIPNWALTAILALEAWTLKEIVHLEGRVAHIEGVLSDGPAVTYQAPVTGAASPAKTLVSR